MTIQAYRASTIRRRRSPAEMAELRYALPRIVAMAQFSDDDKAAIDGALDNPMIPSEPEDGESLLLCPGCRGWRAAWSGRWRICLRCGCSVQFARRVLPEVAAT